MVPESFRFVPSRFVSTRAESDLGDFGGSEQPRMMSIMLKKKVLHKTS